MALQPLLIFELALLGIGTGFLAGLLGIGGGMIMVPFITIILSGQGVAPDLAVKMAIATSMATIIFTSISSVRAHHKRGAVRWDIVKRLAPGIVIGSMIGSLGVFALLKGSYLAIVFGLFVGFSATQMFLDKKPKPTRQMPGTGGQFAVGGVIGFLSGLVGAGGGFISVPFMAWCNVAIHNAVATSAALGFPIALANVTGYVISGLNVIDAVPTKAELFEILRPGSWNRASVSGRPLAPTRLWRYRVSATVAPKLTLRSVIGRVNTSTSTPWLFTPARVPPVQTPVVGLLSVSAPPRSSLQALMFSTINLVPSKVLSWKFSNS